MALKYIPKNITISFTVGSSYKPGDYARLHGNTGVGPVNWTDPVDNRTINLFPNDSGYFGWGHQNWGHFRWSHGQARGVSGWGNLPWGHFPWGRGAMIIKVRRRIRTPGTYAYGFAGYDKAGNKYSGTAGEVHERVDLTPEKPTPLKKNAYAGGVLSFTV